MFTGIIEEMGTVSSMTEKGDSFRISVACQNVSKEVSPGDSVAVNGICLTVTEAEPGSQFFCDAVKETVSRTTVSTWKKGMPVNLEQALTPESRMGGHIVQGHVDGTAGVSRIEKNRTGIDIYFSFQKEYEKYIVSKGSICIDGVSLTVADMTGNTFRVSLVPFTLENTTLGSKKTGDRVNIETDIIGRYVERFLGPEQGSGSMSTGEILQKGFGKRR